MGPASVTVEPGALRGDGTIRIELASSQQQVPEWNAGMIPVSDAVRIDLKGTSLQRPASVAISIDHEDLPEGASANSVFLAFYDERRGGWVPTESRYDPSTGLVSAATTHFSTWQARVPDTQVLSDLISDALTAVVRGLDIRAIPLDCDPEAPAFEMRGPIVGNDPPLIPCVKATSHESEVVVKIANNRAYSILLGNPASDMSLARVTGGSLQDELIRALQRRFDSGVVLVPPGGTVEVPLAIPPGEEVVLTTQSTWLTIGVDFIVPVLSALAPGNIDLIKSAIDCYGSAMGLASTELGWEFALDAILAVVKDCISVVTEGTMAEWWGPIRDGITIGAAAGDLVRDHGINQDNNRLTIANLNQPPLPVLAPDGLGVVRFGASFEDAVAAVSGILGSPHLSAFDCWGSRWALAAWPGGLVLIARDSHTFDGYTYGGSSTGRGPLLAARGIGLGSTASEIRAAYADARMDRVLRDLFGPVFIGGDMLFWMDGPGPAARVVLISAGATICE